MKTSRRIMLVEDSLNDIDLTQAALQEHHDISEIVVTRDGADALDYLRCRRIFAGRTDGLPIVVLLDIKRPKVSGRDVLREMKADPALKNILAVMLTSSREEPDLAQSYALGVNAYVVKPLGFEQFAEVVRQPGVFWNFVNEPPLYKSNE